MLMLVMVFSFSIVGSAYYDETLTYYDYVLNTGDVVNRGNVVGYDIRLSDNSPMHLLGARYFFNDDTQVDFQTYTYSDSSFGDNINFNFDYEFYNKNDWKMRFNLFRNLNADIFTSVYTNKKLNEKLTLHNNFKVGFFDNFTGKSFTSGLTYDLNEKNDLRVGLTKGGFSEDFGDLFEDLFLVSALKTKVNGKVNNILYLEKGFDYDNLILREELTYNPSDDLYLEGFFNLDTGDDNRLGFEMQKGLTENVFATAEYTKVLSDESNSWLYAGIIYKF